MSVKITYFVHGTTVDNENHISTGWNPGELSELGIMQTNEASIITREMKFDIIFCSDLNRAVQSSIILFDLKRIQIFYDERLRECNYGIYNGTDNKNVVYSDHIDKPFIGGESLTDVENRIRSFLGEIKSNYNNKRIALIGHRATQLALDVCLKNKTWENAIKGDWRISGKWKLGWNYKIVIR